MIMRLKNVVSFLSLLFLGWFGSYTYSFFFDATVPELTIEGIKDGKSYGGDISCFISSTKTGEISITLDGQPLIREFKIRTKGQANPFTIPTKTITNGKHILKTELTDNTFNRNKAVDERVFFVDNVPLQAAFLKSDVDYKVLQGRTLHLQFQVNKEIKEAKVSALSNMYNCLPESKNSLIYECFIPILCEEKPSEYLLSVNIIDHVGNELSLDNKFQVVMYPFKKQVLNVNTEKVKQEEELGPNEKEFEKIVEHIVTQSPHEKLFKGTFCAPIDIQTVSCEFGTIRTTQHKGRYAHKALDIYNQPKSVVWATQDGVVVLKDRFASSGNTVIIDHGMGIISLFFHLDDFAKIEVGDKIAKGNPIGKLGKTGYATGYHLHWEMRVNNIQVDPMQWIKATF